MALAQCPAGESRDFAVRKRHRQLRHRHALDLWAKLGDKALSVVRRVGQVLLTNLLQGFGEVHGRDIDAAQVCYPLRALNVVGRGLWIMNDGVDHGVFLVVRGFVQKEICPEAALAIDDAIRLRLVQRNANRLLQADIAKIMPVLPSTS